MLRNRKQEGWSKLSVANKISTEFWIILVFMALQIYTIKSGVLHFEAHVCIHLVPLPFSLFLSLFNENLHRYLPPQRW